MTRFLLAIWDGVKTLLLTVLVFILAQAFLVQPFMVEQQSMERTYEPNDFVLVDKLTPRFTGYHLGDVVIFIPPVSLELPAGVPLIKRVIGVPGDTVDLRNDGVWINNNRLPETYVFDGQVTKPQSDISQWKLGPGQYFVMGDHRAASTDSRTFGPISAEGIIGRVFLRYWPLVRATYIAGATYLAGP